MTRYAARVLQTARNLMPSRDYSQRLEQVADRILGDFGAATTEALTMAEGWNYAQRVMEEALSLLRQYDTEKN